MLTASSGAVVWEAKYESFGRALVDGGARVKNPLRFPGQYEDEETGLHYNWWRYYDPEVGRYLRMDPLYTNQIEGIVRIIFAEPRYLLTSQELNWYSYVLNNPLLYFDPFGLKSIRDRIRDAYDKVKDAENVKVECMGLFKNGELDCCSEDLDQCLKCTKAICEARGPVGSPQFGGCIIPLQNVCSVCLGY
ncbi:RHS repeat-associated core domain-containing protein [Desulfobotulus sp. H1]|uniref:RHS repeat-associated core domain-containing protein n=2 Tax=Desulfobotulus pelophilus TaxID=2823377 RepID=A0ABT3NDC9_9BACT|nr:RHS repeat-associated core domain-containing protein [Desulfobotulus pelophilus]